MRGNISKYLTALALLLACFGASARKKPTPPPQKEKITLAFDLAAFRDSVSALEQRNWDAICRELAYQDSLEYAGLLSHLNRLSALKPVYNASSGSKLGDLVVSMAYEHLGTPYKWAADGPAAFDCSGFVKYCYGQIGYKLPRTSREQYRLGEKVELPDLKKGDVVFWSGRRGTIGSSIGHVGIVSEVDYERGFFYFIHANQTAGKVSISRSNEKYFLLHYKGARRIIPAE